MGRKGKYEEWLTEENLLRVEEWAKNGLTHEDIAHNIGINVATLYDWRNKYPEIDNALKKGKEVADILVENALYKRAIGYTYEETITEITEIPYIDKNGKQAIKKEKHIKKVEKTALPDTTAQIFWLKNRKPTVWRDRQDQVIHSIEDLTPLGELLK